MGPEGVKCHFRGIGSRVTRRRVPSPSAGAPRVTRPSPALTQRQRLVPARPRAPGEARAPASHPLESRRGVDLCPTGNRRSPASVRPLPPCGSQAPAGPERLCPRTRPGAAVPTRVRHTDAQRLPHSFLGPPQNGVSVGDLRAPRGSSSPSPSLRRRVAEAAPPAAPALLAQRSGFKAPPCLREPGQACRRSGPSFASAVRRLLPDAGDRWVGPLETVTCWLSRGRKCSDPPSKHPGVPAPAHAASLCLALRELAKPSSRTAAPVRVPRAALRAPPWPRGRTPRCPSARHPRRQAVRAAPAASFR